MAANFNIARTPSMPHNSQDIWHNCYESGMTRLLCVDLYCGLGGWASGFLAEGYNVIGFDNGDAGKDLCLNTKSTVRKRLLL